ncbi:uncharacterized protein [Littorina saxatilis]|uniref:uncharacterized protein n=1 Tax=Littorina saxatilis TaxID=31220 RepID=UPI0038B49508
MLPRGVLQVIEGFAFILLLVHLSEGKKCLKREVIAHRENNDYECNHPVYSECCEHGDRFTCCEPILSRNLREQLQLWGVVGVMVAVGAFIYSCLVKDNEIIRSDTLKEAATNLGRKIGVGGKKGVDETAIVSTSDRAALTTNVKDGASAKRSFTNPSKPFYDV